MTYTLHINGAPRTVAQGDDWQTLLAVLHDQLDLPGAKHGCDDGRCGACSVRVDGRLVLSCLLPAVVVQGRVVETIEGQGCDGALSVIQEAFLAAGAIQCGYCTPGLVLATAALLDADPTPTQPSIRAALAGNLCRCTGYGRVLAAVEQAVQLRHG